MIHTLSDYYRIPDNSFDGVLPFVESTTKDAGFFQFGPSNICYGRCQSGVAADVAGCGELGAWKHGQCVSTTIRLPFDFTEGGGNIRMERYRLKASSGNGRFAGSERGRQL